MDKLKDVTGTVAVIVAAGSSRRMGFDKLLHKLDGVPVLRRTVQCFDSHPGIDGIVLVAGDNLRQVQAVMEATPTEKPLQIVQGGETRMHSVMAGVQACPGAGLVAIHDGARPFASAEMISRVLRAAEESGAAAPGVPVKDTIKTVENGFVAGTPRRDRLVAVQTPQVFRRGAYIEALEAVGPGQYGEMTDDCMVMEQAGRPVQIVPGEEENYKITTPADLRKGLPGGIEADGKKADEDGGDGVAMEDNMDAVLRIGHGYDVHRLVENRRLIIGGVDIPYEKGLLGHSDADVLLHAVSDALLGAVALGDIGRHFPDTDPAYKGASSLVLLEEVGKILYAAGWAATNIDATLLCQAPKLAAHIPDMRENIAKALRLKAGSVSVKATTEEGLGFTGSGEGIAAHCVALVQALPGRQ